MRPPGSVELRLSLIDFGIVLIHNRTMMKRWKRIALKVYLAGVVIWGCVLLWTAHDNGAFQRHHTPANLAMIAVEYMAMALLWPLLPLPR